MIAGLMMGSTMLMISVEEGAVMAQQSALYSALYYLVHFSGLPDYEPLKRIKLVFIWVSF